MTKKITIIFLFLISFVFSYNAKASNITIGYTNLTRADIAIIISHAFDGSMYPNTNIQLLNGSGIECPVININDTALDSGGVSCSISVPAGTGFNSWQGYDENMNTAYSLGFDIANYPSMGITTTFLDGTQTQNAGGLLDSIAQPIFTTVIDFVVFVFTLLWPFFLVVGIVWAFAHSFTNFINKMIKNE